MMNYYYARTLTSTASAIPSLSRNCLPLLTLMNPGLSAPSNVRAQQRQGPAKRPAYQMAREERGARLLMTREFAPTISPEVPEDRYCRCNSCLHIAAGFNQYPLKNITRLCNQKSHKTM